MGISVSLIWDKADPQSEDDYEYEYVFKLSAYPYQLQDYGDFDAKCPDNLDVIFLKEYEQWLEKLLFLCQFAPEKYLEFSNGSISHDIEIVKESIRTDLKQIRDMYNEAKLLQQQNKHPRLSVG